MDIESTLMRLREATAEINRATSDSMMKATLEKTWMLQDRLVFPNCVDILISDEENPNVVADLFTEI